MSRRLILLAHPDDEMLCLPHLIGEKTPDVNEDVYFYLTLNSTSGRRIQEARHAIALLNRKVRASFLYESDFSIRDGFVWSEFKIEYLTSIIELCNRENVSEILTFAYEGGHQDHDFVNIVASLIGQSKGIEVKYFGGYRKTIFLPLFTVSSPLRKKFPVRFSKIFFLLLFFKLVRIHRSQFIVWFFLSPGILIRTMFFPTFFSEEKGNIVRKDCLIGSLYELRNKSKVADVEKSINSLVSKVREEASYE